MGKDPSKDVRMKTRVDKLIGMGATPEEAKQFVSRLPPLDDDDDSTNVKSESDDDPTQANVGSRAGAYRAVTRAMKTMKSNSLYNAIERWYKEQPNEELVHSWVEKFEKQAETDFEFGCRLISLDKDYNLHNFNNLKKQLNVGTRGLGTTPSKPKKAPQQIPKPTSTQTPKPASTQTSKPTSTQSPQLPKPSSKQTTPAPRAETKTETIKRKAPGDDTEEVIITGERTHNTQTKKPKYEEPLSQFDTYKLAVLAAANTQLLCKALNLLGIFAGHKTVVREFLNECDNEMRLSKLNALTELVNVRIPPVKRIIGPGTMTAQELYGIDHSTLKLIKDGLDKWFSDKPDTDLSQSDLAHGNVQRQAYSLAPAAQLFGALGSPSPNPRHHRVSSAPEQNRMTGYDQQAPPQYGNVYSQREFRSPPPHSYHYSDRRHATMEQRNASHYEQHPSSGGLFSPNASSDLAEGGAPLRRSPRRHNASG